MGASIPLVLVGTKGKYAVAQGARSKRRAVWAWPPGPSRRKGSRPG